MITEEMSNRLENIKKNNYDGATSLTAQVIQFFIDYLKQIKSENKVLNKDEIRQIIIQLANVQPSMAPILLFCNRILIMIDTEVEKNLFKSLMNYCLKSLQSIQYASERIDGFAEEIISDNDKIVTYSSSSLVLHFLKYLKDNDYVFSVYCSESRPINEGLIFTEQLNKYEIDVTLMTDASLFSSLFKYDLVLLGADAISISGVTNKIGSNVITMLADHYKIPIYSLSLIEKILPYPYKVKAYQNHDIKEITAHKSPHLTVENKYFDTSPLNLFTGVITQEGVFKMDDLKSYMKSVPLHDAMKKLLVNSKE